MDETREHLAPAEPAPAIVTDEMDVPVEHPGLRIDRVATLTLLVAGVLLTLMLARVVQLQTAPGALLASHGGDRVTARTEPGVRGDFRDRRGRPIAMTRFAYRVFIDPVDFPSPPEEHVARLADAIDVPFEEIMRRLAPRIAENERLRAAQEDDDPWTEADRPLLRYVALNQGANGGVIEDWRVEMVRGLKIRGVHLELRPVREGPASDLVAGLVGKVGYEQKGLLGVEKSLDAVVQPQPGRLEYVRDAKGRPLWVNEGGYTAPERGEDVRLSIDLEIQRIVLEEVDRGVEKFDAAGGRCVVMDPRTGEVLAIVDVIREVPGAVAYQWDVPIGQERGGRPRYITINADKARAAEAALARNRCVEDVYEPGSTFKPFMWAAATELGMARPTDVIDTEHGRWRTPYGRSVNDVTARATMTWRDVLVNSSNIGMAKVTSGMSFDQMRDAVISYGFGRRTDIGLPGEAFGLVTSRKNWSKYSQTSVAMGHEVAVTPVQIARAFCVFARNGDLSGTLPPATLHAVSADSARGGSAAGPRVLPPQVAMLTREAMRGVTHNLDQRMARNDPDAAALRYEAFGKSGTAEIPLGPPPKGKRRPRGSDGYFQGQYNASFIAGAPFDEPRIVVVVVIDDPGPSLVANRRHYGAATAGPVARRIIERTLEYLGVPANAPATENSLVAGAR
ncbi:MAG: penicillin-binding protein 2 [Phycisphaeraceae bacterium]|nr:penicillin-binding protein 2 [Phycisphaeraceae bacterium]